MPKSNKRLTKVITAACVIALGLIYGYVLIPMGWYIPCAFKKITGLKCPGCGITGICLKILNLDFEGIFRLNFGFWIVLPCIVYIILDSAVRNLLNKKQKSYRIETNSLIIGLLAWAVIRNIYGV